MKQKHSNIHKKQLLQYLSGDDLHLVLKINFGIINNAINNPGKIL